MVEWACRLLDVELTVREISDPAEAAFPPGGIAVLCPPDPAVGAVETGRMEPRLGEAVARSMRLALALAS